MQYYKIMICYDWITILWAFLSLFISLYLIHEKWYELYLLPRFQTFLDIYQFRKICLLGSNKDNGRWEHGRRQLFCLYLPHRFLVILAIFFTIKLLLIISRKIVIWLCAWYLMQARSFFLFWNMKMTLHVKKDISQHVCNGCLLNP